MEQNNLFNGLSLLAPTEEESEFIPEDDSAIGFTPEPEEPTSDPGPSFEPEPPTIDEPEITPEEPSIPLDEEGELPAAPAKETVGGLDLFGNVINEKRTLRDRFIVPPFSVLDARSGYWSEKKAFWLSLGIKSEVGRGGNLLEMSDQILNDEYKKSKSTAARTFGQDLMRGENEKFAKPSTKDALLYTPNSGRDPTFYLQKQAIEAKLGHEISTAEFDEKYYVNNQQGGGVMQTGTSIFDPVLCELTYRWYCPAGGHILDPFAGGSVRGIVAAYLDFKYTGVDLSDMQIKANQEQAQEIVPKNKPRWITGDSRDIKSIAPGEYDLIFSCPPYYDLEVYGNDARDLSVCDDYAGFLAGYGQIIAESISMLKDNRFACFVVGDIRDPKGFYRGLPVDTIKLFEKAGVRLYNECILVTNVGSLPVRIARQFGGYRKLGKTHQNVLVFYKGDPKAISKEVAKEQQDAPVSVR